MGGIIAEKSSMKSPALKEGMKPVIRLEKDMSEKNRLAMTEWERQRDMSKIREAAYKEECKKILRNNIH